MYRILVILLIVLSTGSVARSANYYCGVDMHDCQEEAGGRGNSSPAMPSTSSRIDINPSAVPVTNRIGGEVIYFHNQLDPMLVKGTGRVGASISPSNGENTFFGPMGFESNSDFLNRMDTNTEYASQALTLSGAVAAFSNHRSALDRLELSFGASAKFNKVSHIVWPGAGVSGILGPLTFGYSISEDQYIYNSGTSTASDLHYSADTSSLGLYLNSVAIDYSLSRTFSSGNPNALVALTTLSLLLPRWILTAAYRSEDSNRPAYNFLTHALVTQELKTDTFAGVQFALTREVLLEMFYNYYLMHDVSFGLTIFF